MANENFSSLVAGETLDEEGFGEERRAYLRSKRIFDILVTLTLAPFAMLIIGGLAILVRLDGGNAFFSQTRLGRNGQIFTLWKLRTMVSDAESRLKDYLAENPSAYSEWHERQKLEIDPRITSFGKFLRKHSLDELPQLFNVMRGEMSLVGPRPMLPEQRASYGSNVYFAMRPGMTGLWQIGDRNSSTFADRAIHDRRYFDSMSFSLDLMILVKTSLVVFKGTGL